MSNNNDFLFLYTSNKKTEKEIPVEFRLGKQNICVDPEEEITSRKQFVLFQKDFVDECDSDIGEYEEDTRFKRLYDVNKLDMYRDNNLLNIYRDLPTFDYYSLDYTQ